MSYIDTFILVAEDCPAKSGVVPQPKANKQTVATIHYDMLAGHPYKHTQEDVLFGTFVRRKEMAAKDLEARGQAMREEFFSKGQPCLRTSPLAKTYGWGFHFDSKGKVALYPMESGEYKKLAKEASKVLKAMRSSRKQRVSALRGAGR